MIGTRVLISQRPHRVTLQNPGPDVPDGDGGFVTAWIDCVPPMLTCAIEPATGEKLERLAAGAALIATATHIVKGPFHPQITTETRLLFGARVLLVSGVANRDERDVELTLVCTELVR